MSRNNKQKIVIVGGGYAGLQAALYLNPNLCDITIIEQSNFHELLPELPHKITDRKLKAQVPFSDLLKGKRVRFIQAAIKEINYQTKRIDAVNGKVHSSVVFDHVIFALGSQPNYFNIPGLEDNSIPFYKYEHVEQLRNKLNSNFTHAAELEEDSAEYRSCLSVVIGGAGLTGVEVVGELLHLIPKLANKHDLPLSHCKIYLIEGMDRVLPAAEKALSDDALKYLKKQAILEIILGKFVASVTESNIFLNDERKIDVGTMIWTGGIRSNYFFDKDYIDETGESKKWETGRCARLIVNEKLQIQGVPNTYAIGDNALYIDPETNEACLQNAQLAYKQGRYLAMYLNEVLENKENPSFHAEKIISEGVLVSFGPIVGGGTVYKPTRLDLPVGIPARMMKKVIEARYKYLDIRKN